MSSGPPRPAPPPRPGAAGPGPVLGPDALDPEFRRRVWEPLLAAPTLTGGATPIALEAEPQRGGIVLRLAPEHAPVRVRLSRGWFDRQPIARSAEWEVAILGALHHGLPAAAWRAFLASLDGAPELSVLREAPLLADHVPRQSGRYASAAPLTELPAPLQLALELRGTWEATRVALEPVLTCALETVPTPERATCAALDVGAGAGALVAALRWHGFRRARGLDSAQGAVALARLAGIPVALGDATVAGAPQAALVTAVRVFDLPQLQGHDAVRRALLAGMVSRLAPSGTLLIAGAGELAWRECEALGLTRWPWAQPWCDGPTVHRLRWA